MEFLSRYVEKFPPFFRISLLVSLLGVIEVSISFGFRGRAIDELENEGSSRYNASSSWETVDLLAQILRAIDCPTYKSRPTIFSNTELFPEDCDPTTTI